MGRSGRIRSLIAVRSAAHRWAERPRPVARSQTGHSAGSGSTAGRSAAGPRPRQGDGFAGITGDLVDGRFSEKEAKAIANQNSKLLRVRLGEPFMARQGSMVAIKATWTSPSRAGGVEVHQEGVDR